MNTHDKIELPPLPEPSLKSFIVCANGQEMRIQSFDKDDMQAYARAAIEADRQRRGEPVTNTHIDDDAVDHFAAAMKEKLSHARAKGRSGWHECAPANLSAMLRDHVEKGDPRDVANFCMFLWSLGHPISAAPQPAEPVPEGFVPVAAYDRLQALADSQAGRLLALDVAQEAEPVKVPSDAEDDIVDLLAEYADHNVEHGRMSFDKWTLREAISALIARYGAQPATSDERLNLILAAISTAALGYWQEGDNIRPEFDTVALRDVAKLYAKYAALSAASAQPVVTDAMHAHFEALYNGLELADQTEIIEGILKLAGPVAAQPVET